MKFFLGLSLIIVGFISIFFLAGAMGEIGILLGLGIIIAGMVITWKAEANKK